MSQVPELVVPGLIGCDFKLWVNPDSYVKEESHYVGDYVITFRQKLASHKLKTLMKGTRSSDSKWELLVYISIVYLPQL